MPQFFIPSLFILPVGKRGQASLGEEIPYYKRKSHKRRYLLVTGAVALAAVLTFGGWWYYESLPSYYGPGPIEI
jgi:hypothetical protein